MSVKVKIVKKAPVNQPLMAAAHVTMKDFRQVFRYFLVTLGIVSGIVGILGTQGRVRVLSFIVLGLTLIMLLVFYVIRRLRLRRRMMGVPEDILEEVGTRCSINPTRPEDIGWVAYMEAKKYDEDAVPERILRQWYDANPHGFFIIRVMDGDKIGHLDILPIRPGTFQEVIDGKIVEKEILGDSLHPPKERDEIRNLYIESIIVEPPDEYTRSIAVRHLLFNIDTLVERLCPPDNVEKIFGLAATNDGTSFMRRLGFELVTPARERKDGLDLFSIPYSEFKAKINKKLETQRRA